jgi:hypothetical protein
MVLRNKLITAASHAEHMTQWEDQVKGLRERLADQEESHRQERARDNERNQVRIEELRNGYEDRLRDRDARFRDLAAQLDRAWSAFTLTDEAYQQVTQGRIHEYGAALRTLARVLQSSPLADTAIEGSASTVGTDDGGTGSEDAGSVDRH